jgi:hypothetical protein
VSDLYERSSSLNDDCKMELTEIEIHDDGLSEFADDIQGDVRSSTSSSRDYRFCRYSSSPKSPSSNYMPYSNLNSGEITDWREGYPTSIVFRGLKNSSAKRSMMTATYPVEELSVYGTLFEQADPWDTIGQILGLPSTKPSRRHGEVIDDFNEIDWNEASFEIEERPEITQLSVSETGDIEDIGQILNLPHTKPSRPGEVIDEFNESFETSSAVVETEERDIEDEQLFIGDEHESALAIPELEELDGLFIGPSLFELEDEL